MPSSLRQSIGQLFVGGFTGTEVPEDFARLARLGKLGGSILFSRNLTKGLEVTQALNRELHALNPKEPLLVALDQEGGRVQRLRAPFPELPPMRALGDCADPEVARSAGEILGQSLRGLGFDLNFAPVLDVDSNPLNPVIGDRAFSAKVEVVCQMGTAFVGGLQSQGVGACGKHFPGHGDTLLDSHLDLPRIDHSLARLRRVELPPFEAAARAQVASIMSAHVVYAVLDPDRPATLSPHVLRPILREEMGFDGVIVSDDLEMGAITDRYAVPEAAVEAMAAGCDQVLVCHHPELLEAAHDAVEKAIVDGRLAAHEVERSIARVRAMKVKYVRVEVLNGQRATFPEEQYRRLLATVGDHRQSGDDPTERV